MTFFRPAKPEEQPDYGHGPSNAVIDHVKDHGPTVVEWKKEESYTNQKVATERIRSAGKRKGVPVSIRTLNEDGLLVTVMPPKDDDAQGSLNMEEDE